MRVVLTVVKGPHEGREFAFDQHDNFIVGRAKFARFRLSTVDGAISRVHFLVEVNPPRCRLMDMGSTNGTVVNRKKVPAADLKHGDLIGIGKETVIRVSLEGPPPSVDVADGPAAPQAMNEPPRAAVFLEQTLVPPSSKAGRAGGATPHSGTVSPASSAATRTFHHGDPCQSCGMPTAREAPKTAEGMIESLLSRLCPGCQAQSGKLARPIAGFRLVRVLGQGGMGVVYLAVRETDGALLAVKTVQPTVAGSRTQIERFLREASILQQLEHPRIVSFRAAGESNGLLYFVMEYVPGVDASDLQKRHGGPLPVALAVGLTCQMLEGLAYAHARGFVHRDIKPANLLVESQNGCEFARLTDFGLARTYQASQMSGLTMHGDVGGTIAYMAPEQITHFREAKPPADQYAAAASLYRFFTDQIIYNLPRPGAAQLLMILQDEPVPILSRRPDLPPKLAEIIHRALARDPAERFPDVGAFSAALEPFRNR